eukprot:679914-Rhodomonas_salina.1
MHGIQVPRTDGRQSPPSLHPSMPIPGTRRRGAAGRSPARQYRSQYAVWLDGAVGAAEEPRADWSWETRVMRTGLSSS